MTELIGIYDLLNRHTSSFEDASLYSPIGDSHIRDYQGQWMPAVRKKLEQLGITEDALAAKDLPKLERIRIAKALAAANLQDQHWRWPEKVRLRSGDLEWQSFAIHCGRGTQGLMFVSLVKRCREPSQEGEHLVYVDLLSTAPWNRNGFTDRPLYKGVGRVMLVAAVSLSTQEGFKGRVGLHSLPQSLTWYRDTCRMTDLGSDIHNQNLHYFEMTSTQAKAFVEK